MVKHWDEVRPWYRQRLILQMTNCHGLQLKKTKKHNKKSLKKLYLCKKCTSCGEQHSKNCELIVVVAEIAMAAKEDKNEIN